MTCFPVCPRMRSRRFWSTTLSSFSNCANPRTHTEANMRILKINDLPEQAMDTATPIAGWTGGPVSRTRQAIIGEGQSENFRCNVVNFRAGATTGWHGHDCDQILVVTGVHVHSDTHTH